jgi:hypothetical protein
MRHLLLRSLAALGCLGVFSLPQTSAALKPDQPDKPNFSGTWTLDLKASTSLKARTAWSEDHKQLVATHQIKTKQGKDGQLIIKRYRRRENLGGCFHPRAQRRTKQNLGSPNLAQASLSNRFPSQKSHEKPAQAGGRAG